MAELHYEAKERIFGNGTTTFRCKSSLDFFITLAHIRQNAEPKVPLTGLWLEIMESALRTFASPNKKALLDGKGIDMIYVEDDDKSIRHMVVVVEGEHTPFSIATLTGYKPEKAHILMRKDILRLHNQKPYEIISI